MHPRALAAAASLFALLAGLPLALAGPPAGWFKHGTNGGAAYELDGDRSTGVARLRSSTATSDQFGGLMQYISPADYRGKRVRFSAELRTEKATWGSLWMRVDAEDHMLAFDNMSDRLLKGSTGWTRCSIVLEVGERATGIAFGAMLGGTGELSMRDAKFEVVDASVPVTSARLPASPANLDFRE